MSDQNLFGAFIDGRRLGERPRVAGVALRPFSVWHLFLLQAIDSPFVRMGDVRRLDLLRALAVCRLSYPDSHLRLPVWRTLPSLRKGQRRLVADFLAYTGSYLYRPEYAVVERPGGRPGEQVTNAPEIMRLVGDLIGFAPWSEAAVWNLPAGKAWWYQAMALRARGVTLSYLDDEEREFQAAMRAEKDAEASAAADAAASKITGEGIEAFQRECESAAKAAESQI